MEIIISILGYGLSLVLSSNLIMSLVKYLSVVKDSKVWLRGTLIVVSALGVVSAAALSGNPVDFNQLSDLGTALIETLVLAVGSHYSYKFIKKA